MIRANELHVGSCIRHNGKLWKVVSKNHVKPGKGGAFIQATLKNPIDGTKLDERFSSDETIEKVILSKKDFQFSYAEGNVVFAIDSATYETIEITSGDISKDDIELIKNFATEDTILAVEYADDLLIGVTLPNSIEMEIDIADPVVKGQTAASSYKSAILKNGIKIAVPPYVTAGDKVIVNPYGEKGITFVSRA